MKIGLLREEKVPRDYRVALSPAQCAEVMEQFKLEIVVQPSPHRCFPDQEYAKAGLLLQEDLADCDVLIGIKEVPAELLLEGKTYFFFSHTIKGQAANRPLLREVLQRRITLIDYETIKDERGRRLLAFGYFAGKVGAHNALWSYGRRMGNFTLPRMQGYPTYEEAVTEYGRVMFPPVRIVLTGTGRVGQGASAGLQNMGIRQVTPEDYLSRQFPGAVFTQLTPRYYVKRPDNMPFTNADFYAAPEQYESNFRPFYESSDLMINGINWNPAAPHFFSRKEMNLPTFRIRVIADISCDVAPAGSIPATLRATTIKDPVMGYDPATGRETLPHQTDCIDVMSIDNLPSELPASASKSFGRQLIQYLFPELIRPESGLLERATIAKEGVLQAGFRYLSPYLVGVV